MHSLSINALAVWPFILAATDDCGVVMAQPFKLCQKAGIPVKLHRHVPGAIQEYVKAGIGAAIEHHGEQFFVFTPKTFEREQGDRIRKRKRSEYLNLSVEEFKCLVSPIFSDSGNVRENPGTSGKNALRLKEISIKPLSIKEEGGVGETEFVTASEIETSTPVLDAILATVEVQTKNGPTLIRTFEERIPPEWATPDFVEQWRAWVRMRHGPHGKNRKTSPVDESKADYALDVLREYNVDHARRTKIVRQSVVREWDGFFNKLETDGDAGNKSTAYGARAGHTVSPDRLQQLEEHYRKSRT